MLRLIFSRIGNGVLRLYDNGHILVRSLLPFLLLLAGNLILGGCGVVGILIAAVIDIIAILVLYSSKKDLQQIVDTAVRLGRGDLDLKVDLSDMHGENRELAEAVNGIGDGIKTAVEKSMKDERLKADLITNVSHDIKNAMTSIINFVNLLKARADRQRARERLYTGVGCEVPALEAADGRPGGSVQDHVRQYFFADGATGFQGTRQADLRGVR